MSAPPARPHDAQAPLRRTAPAERAPTRPLTGAVLLRRAREASLERAALAAAALLALTAGSFAGYAILGGARPYDVRAVLPERTGPFAWKRAPSPAAGPAAIDLDPTVTGAIPEKPAAAASERAEAPPEGGYALRAVTGGTALLEGAGGLVRVAPGGELPGAGRVLAIRNTGAGWVVITTQTIIGPARP